MTTSKATVEPEGSKAPIRSGMVTLIRYQLKQIFPVERRCSKVLGSMISHPESSNSLPPALGV